MSVIAGATIDYTDFRLPNTPRFLDIPHAAGDTILVQDIWDTLSTIAAVVGNGVYAKLINRIASGGKNQLTGKQVGITIQMNNLKVRFPSQPGPTWTDKEITGGNLTAVDHLSVAMNPKFNTDFVNINIESDVSAALIETGISGLTASEALQLSVLGKILRNRQYTDPATGIMTVFDDDNVTPLFTTPLFEDIAGTVKYRGKGANRRDRLI